MTASHPCGRVFSAPFHPSCYRRSGGCVVSSVTFRVFQPNTSSFVSVIWSYGEGIIKRTYDVICVQNVSIYYHTHTCSFLIHNSFNHHLQKKKTQYLQNTIPRNELSLSLEPSTNVTFVILPSCRPR